MPLQRAAHESGRQGIPFNHDEILCLLSNTRDLIQDTGKLHLLALIDETTLCRGLDLIGKTKEIDRLTMELEKVLAKLAELKKW